MGVKHTIVSMRALSGAEKCSGERSCRTFTKQASRHAVGSERSLVRVEIGLDGQVSEKLYGRRRLSVEDVVMLQAFVRTALSGDFAALRNCCTAIAMSSLRERKFYIVDAAKAGGSSLT